MEFFANKLRTSGWLEFLKPAPQTASSGLLTIPGELRNRIYELCLLENDHVYPYDYKPCGCDCPKGERVAPSTGILGVNRQINREATPLLYGRVIFHIETGYGFMRFSSPSKHICMFSHPTEEKLYLSRHLIRRLNFGFLPEIPERGSQASRMRDFWKDEDFRALSTRQRAQAIHEHVNDLSKAVWEQAGQVLAHMRGLQKLELDIEKVLCPQGCCRMVRHVVKVLQGLKKKENLEVTVVGDMDEGEVSRIIEGLKYDASLGDSSGLDVDDEDNDGIDGDLVDSDEDGDEEEGSSDDDMLALSEMSDIDTDVADSDISSASTIPLPTDMLDSAAAPSSSSESEKDD